MSRLRPAIAALACCVLACDEQHSGDYRDYAAEPGDADYCEPTLDDPTPLGLTGAQVLALYGDEFDITLEQRDYRRGDAVLASDRVHVRVELRERDVDEAANCAAVALPMNVYLTGAQLRVTGAGVLVGSVGSLNFAGTKPRGASGHLMLGQRGREVSVSIDGSEWSGREEP